jgi:hypothetical protein
MWRADREESLVGSPEEIAKLAFLSRFVCLGEPSDFAVLLRFDEIWGRQLAMWRENFAFPTNLQRMTNRLNLS